MVPWVVGSTPRGGPNELFVVPISAPQLVFKEKTEMFQFGDA